MPKNNERIDLSQVVASPILTGTNDKYMWTGAVKSENITAYLISDDKKRTDFTKLVKRFESLIKQYRSEYHITDSILAYKQQQAFLDEADKLESKILEVGKEIKAALTHPEESGIDIDLFWVQLCREYEDILENNPEEIKHFDPEAKKNIERFRISMNSHDPCVREVYMPNENRYACYQYLTKGQEKRFGKTGESNIEKLLKVISDISGLEDQNSDEGMEILKEIVTPITLVDLVEIFPHKRYADMQYVTVFKNYLLKRGHTSEEIEAMDVEEITEKAMETYNDDSIGFHSSLVADAISTGIDYVDMEKFLLAVMVRPLTTYDLMSPKLEDTDTLIEPLKELQEKAVSKKDLDKSYIQQECSMDLVMEKTKRTEHIIRKILETGFISKKAKVNILLGEKNEEYDLRKLNGLMKKFCDGIYLTDVIQLNLIYSAYLSETEMDKWSDELIQRLNFSENDKMVISLINFRNLERLYANGKIDKETIKKLLAESGKKEFEENLDEKVTSGEANRDSLLQYNSKYLLKNLYESHLISEEEIRKYFDEGIINSEMLETLEKDKSEEELKEIHQNLGKHFNKEMLLEKYKKYAEKYIEFTKFQFKNPKDTEKIESLREELNLLRTDKDIVREIFSRYNLEISEEEKHKLGDELLETYYIEMEVDNEDVLQESIKMLYEDGLIDLENIIGLDKKYITPMLDTLSLEDASKIRSSMDIRELEELIDEVFKDKSFSDERRFIVIMNLVGEDSDYDKMLREYYLGLLEFDGESERKAKPQGTKRNKTGEGSKESNKYIYPDFVKWKFYKALDKDVRVTRYSNGFVEFASSKLGVRIIEKYYDGDKPAYGTATYIMQEQDYRKNQSDLITLTPKGSILESATLREITPRKDRIAHRTQSTDRTWMDDIVKYFDIDYERENDSRYSKEELENLQNTVKKYKTEYEMIIE